MTLGVLSGFFKSGDVWTYISKRVGAGCLYNRKYEISIDNLNKWTCKELDSIENIKVTSNGEISVDENNKFNFESLLEKYNVPYTTTLN